MKKLFHHILQHEKPIISCTIGLETYFIAGEEVTQDEIVAALAYEFDNDATRASIADDVQCIRDEMEYAGNSEKEIKMASRSFDRWPDVPA